MTYRCVEICIEWSIFYFCTTTLGLTTKMYEVDCSCVLKHILLTLKETPFPKKFSLFEGTISLYFYTSIDLYFGTYRQPYKEKYLLTSRVITFQKMAGTAISTKCFSHLIYNWKVICIEMLFVSAILNPTLRTRVL